MPKALFWVIIVVLIVVVFASQGDRPTATAADQQEAPSDFVSTGDRALTVAGFVACSSEDALDRVLNLVGQKDRQAAERFIAEQGSGCLVLAGGDTVVKSGAAMFRIRIRVPGEPQELHTVSEAIRPLR